MIPAIPQVVFVVPQGRSVLSWMLEFVLIMNSFQLFLLSHGMLPNRINLLWTLNWLC